MRKKSRTVADKEQVALLRRSVEEWNEWYHSNPNTLLNLKGANLRGANLRGANLSCAFLDRADLRGANLNRANLNRADLRGANLDYANLSDADLSRAFLSRANLDYANLEDADLSRAFLRDVTLNGAILSGAILRGANLSGATLSGAALSGTILSGVALSGADLSGIDLLGMRLLALDLQRINMAVSTCAGASFYLSNLSRAVLNEANFSRASLAEVNLAEAKLLGINLRNADLTEANLRGALLLQADLEGANLSRADLSNACLSWANLSRATLRYANFTDAKLEGAKLRHTKLRSANFTRADLTDANLHGAFCSYANFAKATLDRANLSATDLTNANLRRVQVLGTRFTDALLTGACIAEWNPNSATNLKGIICDYVYLKSNQQERRPSDPNTTFAPGEFSSRYQKARETLDLYFSDGIDWRTFADTLQEVREEQIVLEPDNPDANLTVRAIETRDDGSFVIRVNVPETLDKAQLEATFQEKYEQQLALTEARYEAQLEAKDGQLALQREHNASLERIILQLANKPQPPIIVQSTGSGDPVSVQGNAGSIKNQGDQANVAGEVQGNQIANNTDPKLIAELQILLRSASHNRPTETPTDRAIIAGEVIETIEARPALKARAIAAAKNGLLEALKSNPIGAFVTGAIEGWTQS